MMFPLLIAGVCILSSLIGTFYVKLGESENIMGALYKGLLVTGGISAILIYMVTDFFIGLEHVISDSTLFIIHSTEWICLFVQSSGYQLQALYSNHRILYWDRLLTR